MRFFITEYRNDEYAAILGNKVLYCSADNECKKFSAINGLTKVENVPELYGDHLEADTRMAFHAKHADEVNPGNIVIRANDTEIMVILLANAKKFNSHIWYDCGLDSVNTRCYVDITNLAKTINYVDALPGIYVYTGCDYTSAFYEKGKVQPLALMMKHQKYLDVFSSLGDTSLEESCMKSIEEFTCALYGYSKMTNIHQVNKWEFEKKSKPKPNGNPLDRIKSVDPTTFLSNYNTLYEQIKRAWYIASIYKTATEPYPSFENDPVDYGYKLSNNQSNLEMKWFHGDQVPASLEEIINENELSDDDDIKNDEDNEDDDSDISDKE